MKNKVKKSLFTVIVSLILCVFMAIGTTFAWFTDSVTSGTNRIIAGNLDIDLVMDKEEKGTYVSIAEENGAIFGGENSLIAQNKSSDTLWEPGKTQIVYLGVQNKGTLAVKYNILLTITDGGLASALEYAIIDGAKASDLTSVTDWETLKSATTQKGDVTAGTLNAAEGGVLDEIVRGTKDETDYFALAVHMKEDAGNDYMKKDVTIDVLITASQYTAERDSFDDQYDKQETGKTETTEKYLTFTAKGNSSVTPKFASGSNLQYRINGGTWTDRAIDSEEAIVLQDKDVLELKGKNCTTSESCNFSMTGSIAASGDVTSLTNEVGGDATLSNECYNNMFLNCASLTKAPNLPSTILEKDCYKYMFKGCTKLAQTPELPATTLAEYCYDHMFSECLSLTTTPNLPATELEKSSYSFMFEGCENLIKVTALPDNLKLKENSIAAMFERCSHLNVQEGGEMPVGGGKIFTCPTGDMSKTASNMFKKTSNASLLTPTSGVTYYWIPMESYSLTINCTNCSYDDTNVPTIFFSDSNAISIVFEKTAEYNFPDNFPSGYSPADITIDGCTAQLQPVSAGGFNVDPNKKKLVISNFTGDVTIDVVCTPVQAN